MYVNTVMCMSYCMKIKTGVPTEAGEDGRIGGGGDCCRDDGWLPGVEEWDNLCSASIDKQGIAYPGQSSSHPGKFWPGWKPMRLRQKCCLP